MRKSQSVGREMRQRLPKLQHARWLLPLAALGAYLRATLSRRQRLLRKFKAAPGHLPILGNVGTMRVRLHQQHARSHFHALQACCMPPTHGSALQCIQPIFLSQHVLTARAHGGNRIRTRSKKHCAAAARRPRPQPRALHESSHGPCRAACLARPARCAHPGSGHVPAADHGRRNAERAAPPRRLAAQAASV